MLAEFLFIANAFRSLFSFAVIAAMALGGGLHALLTLTDLNV